MLKALVISPNEKTVDLGSLVAIARSEACKREHMGESSHSGFDVSCGGWGLRGSL